MGRRRNRGRPVNGVFILDKPQGLSSNQAMQRVRFLFYANKAGHTGSLDPLATGVLPVCLGEATKFSQYVLDSDKRYLSTFTLGVATETGDSDGEVVDQQSAAGISRQDVERAVASFDGEIEQVPSMYSALKHNGQPLYKLARQGIEVEREARRVTLYQYRVVDFRPGEKAEVDIEVHCSKGTYVRSLAEDLGKLLGCGAHVSALRRTGAGPFDIAQAVTIEQLEKMRETCQGEDLDHLLLPMEDLVEAPLQVDLAEDAADYFCHGQPVMANKVYRQGEEGDIVRVFAEDGPFLGVGTVTDDGKLAPKRLVVY